MAIPEVGRDRLEQALREFDDRLREAAEWRNWEDRKSQKFAIEANGRRYPPKQIVALATDVPVGSFYGGPPTNRYLEARGFRIVMLRPGAIQKILNEIVAGYPQARTTQTFGSEAPMYKLFKSAEDLLGTEEVLGGRGTLSVVASAGQGNWAKVPWIAFLDSRETRSTQQGLYVVILFRQDGSGFYLTFNQGVTEPTRRLGMSGAVAELRARAAALRKRPWCSGLTHRGFTLDENVDLRTDPGLRKNYESSTIAHKFYAKDEVPDDSELLGDLEALLAAYDGYLQSDAHSLKAGAWIFQANPEFYDAREATKQLKQLRWLAAQHADEMKVGDRVYLWESGHNAGVVGIAEIIEPVRIIEADPQSAPFTKGQEKFDGAQPRVTIRIIKPVDPHLARETIKAHPKLAGLSIIRMAQGTNFPVTDSERLTLDNLLTAATAPTDEGQLCLIGTWRNVEAAIERVSQAIATRGGWASPWSFPIKTEAAPLLRQPFHLYINAGGARIPVRLRVAQYATTRGNEGQVSPWPHITDDDWKGKTRVGDGDEVICKTWLWIDEIIRLQPELTIANFEAAAGLSVPSSLLSPVTFGYARVRSDDSMDALAAYTLLDRALLEQIVFALTSPVESGGSPQIVLAGPPGTSKTWVAEAIARHVARDSQRVRLVQLHPNYSYEAFVEGLRPIAEGAGISFKAQHGALLSLVDDMKRAGEASPEAPLYALVIDEMNRANLPRVFGELMYLFEYRDRKIRLQYSAEFSLPPNLRFIGTMNTADRSIRSIDIALRRRFDVFELRPDADVLRRFYQSNELDVPNLIEGFEQLNNRLEQSLDRHHTIGHAFFMKPGLSRKTLRAIWDRKIYPLIEEYFFDQPDIAKTEYVFEEFWPG